MNMSGELNEHTASLLEGLVEEGTETQYSTYGEAIKGLESEKSRLARAELPRGVKDILHLNTNLGPVIAISVLKLTRWLDK